MAVSKEHYVVSGMGRDVTGLVSLVTSIISDVNGNIIDLQESVLHGLFSIFLTVDLSQASISGVQFVSKLQAVAHQSGLQIVAERHRLVRRVRERRMMRLVLLGPDHPGIVSAATFVLANNGVNIERARMISRGELFAMEMDLDRGSLPGSLSRMEKSISTEMKKVGIRCFFQEDIYGCKKRLLVFSIGRNILDVELRDELLAGAAGKIEMGKAPAGLMGLGLDAIDRIAAGLSLASDAEELLHALKRMGFCVGIIIPGYHRFLNQLCRYLCIDHISCNRLLVENGTLTGAVEDLVGDEGGRRALISGMVEDEGVGDGETVIIGDSPPVDIEIADTGIRLFPDKLVIESLLTEGAITREQIPAILSAFGPLEI